MKSQLIAIVAAVLVVGCGESQQSAPAPETDPTEPVAEVSGNPEADRALLNAARGKISLSSFGYEENIEAVKKTLADGADVNAKDEDGRTPLLHAAYQGNNEIAELLLANGADVNAKNEVDTTPLHHAALYGHKETVELFITNGADVNAIIASGQYQGKTPLDLAIQLKRTETADLLRKHGGKTGEELKAEGK